MTGYPTLNYLRQCLAYDPDTGALTRLKRPREHFSTAQGWKVANSRFAGTVIATDNGEGYLQVMIDGTRYLAHRLAYALHHGIELADLPSMLDHRNGDPSDNRIGNLRPATTVENARNARMPSTNKSGLKGACWCKRRSRWQAQISVDGRHRFLGYFDTAEEAAAAYAAAAKEHFGDFVRAA